MQIVRQTFKQQIKTNLVAIISLMTAIGGFSYNNWRDHQNELNQNIRNAAFVVLKDLGELQTIINYAHFESSNTRGNPIEGWKHAVNIRDLSRLLPKSSMQESAKLYDVWEQEWEHLNSDSESEERISQQIARARAQVLESIDNLQ
ncbi:MAG: hypothetical protein ACO1N8_06750 [Methylophilus sp.]